MAPTRRPASDSRPRRQFYRLEGQTDELPFSCKDGPGINVHKAFNGDTQNLEGREDPMFEKYGKKVTYIVRLEFTEYSLQKYAHRAKRTVTRGEAVKQISQVILDAVKSEYERDDDSSRVYLKELRLMSLTRVGKSSFMCNLEHESNVTSHSPVNKPQIHHASLSGLPRKHTAPRSKRPAVPLPVVAAASGASLLQFPHTVPSLEGSAARRGSVSTQTQTGEVVNVCAPRIERHSVVDGKAWGCGVTTDSTFGFNRSLLATGPPSESGAVYPTPPTAEHHSTATIPYPYAFQYHGSSLSQDGGGTFASLDTYTPSSLDSSPTSVTSNIADDDDVGFYGNPDPLQQFGVQDTFTTPYDLQLLLDNDRLFSDTPIDHRFSPHYSAS